MLFATQKKVNDGEWHQSGKYSYRNETKRVSVFSDGDSDVVFLYLLIMG